MYLHILLQQACCSLRLPYSEGSFLIHCQHTQGGWTLYPCSSHPANVLLLLLVQGSLKKQLKEILLWMSCKLVKEQSHFSLPYISFMNILSVLFFHKENWCRRYNRKVETKSKLVTVSRVSQLLASNWCLGVTPGTGTKCSPCIVQADLYSTLFGSSTS